MEFALKFPEWFLEDQSVKNVKFYKIFPEIGLSNFEKNVRLDNFSTAHEFAIDLLYKINGILASKLSAVSSENHAILFLLHQSLSTTSDKLVYFLKREDGKIKLVLPVNIYDKSGKVVYRVGESIFKIYGKISKKIDLPKLESLVEFKLFSANNLPLDDYKLVFSSNDIEGVWDIITMSMRGIKSCQSWDVDNKLRQNIIGSVLDPNCGIIYLTHDKSNSEYGSHMVKRSMVRFVKGIYDQKPKIIIDKMYPSFNNRVFLLFKEELERRSNLPVEYGPEIEKGKYFLPGNYNNLPKPYLDSEILFGDI